MRTWTVALAGALLALATGAAARPAQCYVEVDALTVMDGRCDFDPIDGDGSFVVTTPDGGYFVYVIVTGRGVAEGSWNAERWASHAHAGIGVLVRDDACWSNARATVCAW